MVAPVKIFLTSTGAANWTVPADWNDLNNSIEVIAGGGSGCAAGGGNYGGSGSGGAYSKITNLALTKGALIPVNIGAGGARAISTGGNILGNPGGDTWFGNASYGGANVAAKGGLGGLTGPISNTMGNILGGQASAGIGSIKYSGGGVPNAVISGVVTGAGGAAGPNGNGQDGVSTGGTAYSGRAGGAGDNGLGGAGGAGGSSFTSGNGADGTEFDATHGAGGGGGANCPNWLNVCTAGDGGKYGGGGGGGTNGGGYTNTSGKGGDGLIVITYTPIPVSQSSMFLAM
ncbi:MAG: hypothetical protein JWO78_216 [Micavibrio sp.]|nr:hypothetical protein [Micavibrio sp.]